MKHHLLFIALLTMVLSCNSNKTTDNTQSTSTTAINGSSIDQPLMGVSPTKQKFSFKNENGLVKKTSRHSLIIVPENAFVLENNTPIKGELSIEFSEIFNPAEIILAGIPMNVEKDGRILPFISDGMFSITASCNGQKAKLAEGKTIAVSTTSQKENTDFDYWYFNEEKGEWENMGDRSSVFSEKQVLDKSTELNPSQTELILMSTDLSSAQSTKSTNQLLVSNQLTYKKPQTPAKHNPNDFVFNIVSSYTDYPELATYKNVLWKPILMIDAKERKELTSGMQKSGANVHLECKDPEMQIYKIYYGSRSIEATPVFIGSDRKKIMAAYNTKMNAYVKKMKELEDVKKNAQKAADRYVKTYNMFAVNRMGIYNCDRFYSNPDQCNFTFRSQDKPVEQHIFAVLKNNEGVIALSSAYKQGDHYTLPGKDIIGFVYTDALGIVSFSKQNAGQLKSNNEINLSIYEKTIENPEALQDLIQSF